MNIKFCFPAVLALLIAGCGEPAKEIPAAVKPTLISMTPTAIAVGDKFNLQPNGKSALGLSVKDASSKAVIVFGTQPLETAHGPGVLSAYVPDELYAKPGTTPVFIRDSAGDSNKIDFVVKPK